jgi:hypothetical protein
LPMCCHLWRQRQQWRRRNENVEENRASKRNMK